MSTYQVSEDEMNMKITSENASPSSKSSLGNSDINSAKTKYFLIWQIGIPNRILAALQSTYYICPQLYVGSIDIERD